MKGENMAGVENAGRERGYWSYRRVSNGISTYDETIQTESFNRW